MMSLLRCASKKSMTSESGSDSGDSSGSMAGVGGRSSDDLPRSRLKKPESLPLPDDLDGRERFGTDLPRSDEAADASCSADPGNFPHA